ncbi:maleate cis-trans isomerase [Candidatus Bathyarchaeota archaeon]|nr:MAG: maleate cis-trans isomerase [Candidatus Bathyarchaeota archaeon]
MKRLGLIIPSSNTTMEPEFYEMLPEGFTVHTTRLRLETVTVEGLAKMEEKVEEEAIKLADAAVDVIGFGCTSGSLFKGPGHDRMIEEKIERISGKPAVATAGAVVKALKTLKIKKVAVATPYIAEINELEEKFLVANGLEVVDLKGLELSDNIKIGRIDSQTAFKLVTSLKHETADGIFISCTNFPTIKIIQKIEDELEKPVISSNTATLWAMLKKCKVSVKIKGYGKLLENI